MARKDELLNKIIELSGVETNGHDEKMYGIILNADDELCDIIDEYHQELFKEFGEPKSELDESLDTNAPYVLEDDGVCRELIGDEEYESVVEDWRARGIIK